MVWFRFLSSDCVLRSMHAYVLQSVNSEKPCIGAQKTQERFSAMNYIAKHLQYRAPCTPMVVGLYYFTAGRVKEVHYYQMLLSCQKLNTSHRVMFSSKMKPSLHYILRPFCFWWNVDPGSGALVYLIGQQAHLMELQMTFTLRICGVSGVSDFCAWLNEA